MIWWRKVSQRKRSRKRNGLLIYWENGKKIGKTKQQMQKILYQGKYILIVRIGVEQNTGIFCCGSKKPERWRLHAKFNIWTCLLYPTPYETNGKICEFFLTTKHFMDLKKCSIKKWRNCQDSSGNWQEESRSHLGGTKRVYVET